ncbi:Asp-tRNA(Asn)/Glu-tRNA(Gln) amidotransferase subunit GatC [Clostridium sp. LBM24168]
MPVSINDIKYLASLARLEFNEDEEKKLKEYLNRILNYISKLDELNVERQDMLVNPYHIENKFRKDIVEESLKINDVVENSPEHVENYIVVPRIIE